MRRRRVLKWLRDPADFPRHGFVFFYAYAIVIQASQNALLMLMNTSFGVPVDASHVCWFRNEKKLTKPRRKKLNHSIVIYAIKIIFYKQF